MVLSKPEIERALADGRIGIEPAPDASRIDQVSIDLRLGRKFMTFRGLPPHIPFIRVKASLFGSRDLWDHHEERETFELAPGGFVLAQTLERVVIPNDLVGFVEGRSSWARTGVSIHLTAPKIDPGFDGLITLEIANMGHANVQLVAGEDTPAQIMFMEISTPLREAQLYGAGEDDIFQFQQDPIPRGPPSPSSARRRA